MRGNPQLSQGTLSPATMTLLTSLLLSIVVVQVQGQLSEPKTLHYSIMEELQPNTLIGSIARDAQVMEKYSADVLRTLQFNILKGKFKEKFSVEGNQGLLRTNGTLDRDTICPANPPACEMLLDVALVKPIEHFEIIKVTVVVLDSNDNAPAFPRDRIVIEVSENAVPGVSFVLPGATDLDAGDYGVQNYEFLASTDTFKLDVLDNSDLRLVLTQRLDREVQQTYKMKVIAVDGGSPPKSGSAVVVVKVQDSNDNSPLFDRPVYNVSMSEDAKVRDLVVQVHANDPDEGLNGLLKYDFSQTTKNSFGETFGINETSGEIYLKKELDYETEVEYNLIVAAEDQGPDSMAAHTKVIVHVTDVNDHRPKIVLNTLTARESAEISEWADVGTFVAHISVEDLDKGESGVVACTLHHPQFTLQKLYQSEYKIITADRFDYETKTSYIVTIHCQDEGEPKLTSTKDVVIAIIDENDHAPVFVREKYKASMRENNTAHSPVAVVTATDKDTGLNGQVVYSLAEDAMNLVKIVPDTGVITTNAVFDYEAMQTFEFTVIATDKGTPALSATAVVTVDIIDINDNAPVFEQPLYNFGSFENQPMNTEIGSVGAKDADEQPYNEFTFSLRDTQNNDAASTFSIDPHSGRVTTRKVLDREHQHQYSFKVVATNVVFPHLSSSVNVSVFIADKNDNAPMIIFPRPDNNTVQVPYKAPPGYIFGRVRAEDADLGLNAKLNYDIAKGNENNYFDIDPLSGALSVQTDLQMEHGGRYNLLIIVKDQGKPQKSAVATMNLVINKTLAISGGAKPSGLSHNPFLALGFHQKIIVILGCVTALLVAILITAIVCIKRRQKYQDKETYRYMCRVDATQRISGLGHGDGSHVSYQENIDSPDSPMDRPPGKDGQKLREEQERINALPPPPGPVGSPAPSDTDSRTHLTLDDLQRIREPRYSDDPTSGRGTPQQRNARRPNYGGGGGGVGGQQLPPQLHGAKDVEVHQLLQLLKRDGDSDSTSGCSADMSNADSGKGGSDEGDKDGRHHHKIPPGTLPRPNGRAPPDYASSTMVDPKRRIVQINPINQVHHINQNNQVQINGGRNSPQNRQGQSQQQGGRTPVTYALNRNGRPGSPGLGNTRLPSPPPPPPAPTPTSNKHSTTDSSGGLGNKNNLNIAECTSPLCTCPADTKQQCIDIVSNKQAIGSHGSGTPYEGIHLRTFSPSGYHSPSATLLRTPTSTSSPTTPNANNSNRNSSVYSEEGGSTTSGSYVVEGGHTPSSGHGHLGHKPGSPPSATMDPQLRNVDV